ncbi:putative transcription activator [Bernardetia litoralis DSM 6794]|uniref:Putative transcription activator n=1 Tax=Bernardetia litoralis (strain ATCC 23117 / DSM 6794 / NBRC 15988 / NCIMB 1366 / Fx l1 / Sio-4) TaxID=880071 RepID=I4AFE2_BERLS|nr:TenA family protein [Bernardetia litoralis]AFM02677.1 putative transcription activator [Bernardetia litoralis DSM 6794]
MSSWYEKVNTQTDYILQKIKKHPFITELMDGSLSKDVFNFYINQDAQYLAVYKKMLAALAIKCSKESDTQFFLKAATETIEVENALHQNFLKNKRIIDTPSPSCDFYTSFLASKIYMQPIEVGLAAVLPCFTIYKQIGDYILENQTNKSDNPYQNWINTYGGDDFANSVNQAIEITNRYAQTASKEIVEEMNSAFEKSSKLEWMFWDSAYKKESWKI